MYTLLSLKLYQVYTVSVRDDSIMSNVQQSESLAPLYLHVCFFTIGSKGRQEVTNISDMIGRRRAGGADSNQGPAASCRS